MLFVLLVSFPFAWCFRFSKEHSIFQVKMYDAQSGSNPLLSYPPPTGGGQEMTPLGVPEPICTMSQSTLRMMNSDPCMFCQRPLQQHSEYDISMYQPMAGGTVYGAPPPPIDVHAPPAYNSNQSLPPPYDSSQGPPTYPGPPEDDPPYKPPPQGPIQGNSDTQTFSRGEKFSLAFGWIVSVGFWIHLFVFIPLCESAKANSLLPRPCADYYWFFRYRWYFWVVFSVLYLAYIIQSATAPTRRYLSNILPKGLQDYVSVLVRGRPALWWSIQCYHYRTEHYTDSKGRRRSRRKRVNTHHASGHFNFSAWQDVSGAVLGKTSAPIKRLRSWKKYVFADEKSKAAYDTEFSSWVRANDRDTHKDVSSGLDIPGFEEFTLSFAGSPPAGFNLTTYWVMTVLSFSMFFRTYFFARTTPVDFYCVKKITK